MSPAEVFWTVLVFAAAFTVCFALMGWAWYWALMVAWLATGVAASIMGVR